MKSKFMKTAVASALLLTVGVAQAEEDGGSFGIGGKYSTLGAGVELGIGLSEHFGVRLGANQYSISETSDIDGIDYDADLDLQSTSLMLDWFPMGGSFYLTAGYVNSGNEITAHAEPEGDITIGDTTYNVTAGEVVLDGGIELGSGPYIGFGWGKVPASGFGFTFEAGVMQMGTPDVSLDVTGSNAIIVDEINTSGDKEREIANMEDDLDQYELYPVVSVGISYGF